MADEARTVHKTCNLCEAMCGLRIEVRGGRVGRIEADPDDPLSRGAICPKAIGLAEIQDDPDRLRAPKRRLPDGRFETIGWDEAIDESARRLAEIQRRDGNDAVASYLGNPAAHNFGILMYVAGLFRALDSRNRYSASSLDQNPRHAASLLLYGNTFSIPIPDVDRTDFLLVLGANPLVSNGSLMSAPGFRRRMRALAQRGGRLVVVDPRRSETAELADDHLAIIPGRDAFLLAALIHTVFDEGLGRTSALRLFMDGEEKLEEALLPLSPERVADAVGVEAKRIRRLARDFAGAPTAACYGRIGTCTGMHGSLSSWLIDVLNLLTGNLDCVGGALFPRPAVDLAEILELRGATGELRTGSTRVRGAPCFNDERPTACLAEEILEPGRGRIRGLVNIAGNPCLSAPGGESLTRAFADLEFHVAIDLYINETTRHADIILPPTWSLEHDNYEVLFHGFAVHNTARYSPMVIRPDPEQRDEWEILSALACAVAAEKQSNPLSATLIRNARRLVPSPRTVLDLCLRIGHYGDGFVPWRRGLRLADLEANPSGIDLGPLAPRMAELLSNRGRRLDLSAPPILSEITSLRHTLDGLGDALDPDELLLIGRRDVRSNNSWFHNTRLATKGRDRCTLQMNPADAEARGLAGGERVVVQSRSGRVEVPLEISRALRPGVVSLPHGWGHEGEGLRMRRAVEHPGVNCNILTDPARLESLVGNAIFNGVPVRVGGAES